MNNEQQPLKGIILLILLILSGLFFLMNTNNNPDAIIQRIFRPLHIGGGTIYYAGLFPLLLIYYSLKEIYRLNNYAFLNTRLKRIIIMILLLSILPAFSQSGTKLYKSFCNDLNSIYCYRDNMGLYVNTSENKKELKCKLELENCSKKSEKFYVKVKLPGFFEMKEDTVTNLDELLTLHANERRQFTITLEESAVNSGNMSFSRTTEFEFTLFNDKQEVKFTSKE